MNNLTFRLLEVFQEVVDGGSVTAASHSLALSQPTVSLQLKKLSQIVGLPLLEHFGGKVHMTEAGEATYLCAQEVLTSQAKLSTHIQALQGIETGSLKLAAVTTAKYIIPPMLSAFCKAHPNIDVHFTIGNRQQIAARLKQNRDDIYIFSQPPEDESIQASAFLDNQLVVIAPPDYQGPDNCTLQDLLDEKFLLRENGSGTRKAIDEYCLKNNITFNDLMIIESNEAIRLSVASGLGLAILSKHTLAQAAPDNIRTLNVTDFPLRSSWYVVTRKSRPLSLTAHAFKTSLLEKKI
ncbi:LysR family transcriptional regulator [Alteromonas lipotrueiana]|uniref:LysR family transcriptional regulator n=1 Tax=Alteromonas lipotrueiana TaxID=2803815 RepID=UPI001C46B1B3|nr:LysR family transcriptional regulator [Alteromonas lipotrueiana]